MAFVFVNLRSASGRNIAMWAWQNLSPPLLTFPAPRSRLAGSIDSTVALRFNSKEQQVHSVNCSSLCADSPAQEL